MATHYFNNEQSRQASRKYYRDLMETALSNDGDQAEVLVKEMMELSIEMWKRQIGIQLNEGERS